MPSIRLRHLFAPALVLAALVACSDDASSEDSSAFKDAAGRACTASRSGTVVTCDKPPTPSKGCAGGTNACFSATPGSDTGPDGKQLSQKQVVKNCAGCCSGDSSNSLQTTAAGDCVNIACASDADCSYWRFSCVNGRCER